MARSFREGEPRAAAKLASTKGEGGGVCQFGRKGRQTSVAAVDRRDFPCNVADLNLAALKVPWHVRCSSPPKAIPGLDLFFRKYSWTANLACLVLAAWFSARMVNTLVGAIIRPKPQADLSTLPSPEKRLSLAPALDDARLYHLIGVEPPEKVQEEKAAPASQRSQNCKDPAALPVRSDLRFAVVAAVLADVPRSSLATIADLTTRENRVVGVGDEIGQAELLGLSRMKPDGLDLTGNGFRLVALVCNNGTKEYLDPDASTGEVAQAGLPNLGTAPVRAPARRPAWTGSAPSATTTTRSTRRSSTPPSPT